MAVAKKISVAIAAPVRPSRMRENSDTDSPVRMACRTSTALTAA